VAGTSSDSNFDCGRASREWMIEIILQKVKNAFKLLSRGGFLRFSKDKMKSFLLFLGIAISFQTSAYALTGAEILKKADAMRFVDGQVSVQVEMTDHRGSSVQTTRYKVFSRGASLTRVETIYPERQAGRKLLMKNDDLWFFAPDIKRATRISMQQRLTGEVANGDLARTNFGSDYSVVVEGQDMIGNVKAIRLRLKKARPSVTYPEIAYWVSADRFAPLKAVFKTESGRDLKIATYHDPKPALGKILITRIEVVNALNNKQKSVLVFTGYRKESLSESFFNKESLNN
jgi:outer membrane lipoprotein-sorting protein